MFHRQRSVLRQFMTPVHDAASLCGAGWADRWPSGVRVKEEDGKLAYQKYLDDWPHVSAVFVHVLAQLDVARWRPGTRGVPVFARHRLAFSRAAAARQADEFCFTVWCRSREWFTARRAPLQTKSWAAA